MARLGRKKQAFNTNTGNNNVDEQQPTFFTRGEVEAKKAREKAQAAFLPEFWVKDGEEATIIFLDNESININFHTLNIRGRYRDYTCRGKGCPLCKIKAPSLKAVYRIIDTRVFKDKNGNVTSPIKEKYYKVGMRLQPTVAKLLSKGYLYKQLSEVSRSGTGTSTTYQITPGGEVPERLKALLKKEGLMSAKLNFSKNYAPKPIEDLQELVALFGVNEDDNSSGPPAREEPSRNYLAEDDSWER